MWILVYFNTTTKQYTNPLLKSYAHKHRLYLVSFTVKKSVKLPHISKKYSNIFIEKNPHVSGQHSSKPCCSTAKNRLLAVKLGGSKECAQVFDRHGGPAYCPKLIGAQLCEDEGMSRQGFSLSSVNLLALRAHRLPGLR